MTRLVYWNVRDFARNKIQYPIAGRKRRRGGRDTNLEAERADDRQDYITWLINVVQPDIFVLVENETAYDGRGRLVRGNGLEGAELMWGYIRAATNQRDWALVPPLQTGPNEGVSIFYRATRRYFTGPYIWPGGAGVTAQPPGAVAGNYPRSLRRKLPDRVIPAAAQYNVGSNEYQVAARISFTRRAGLPNPGAGLAFAGRAPYMVTFAETNGGGAVQRNLSLFAIHAPAAHNLSDQYLRDLANIAQITDGLAANEVRSVFGDFNVNLMNNALVLRNAYTALQGQGYTLALTPANQAPAPPDGYRGYYATHIKSWRNAAYWSTANETVYYPGYGYIGSDRVNNLYAIDNIYTRYGGGLNPPQNNQVTILNAVVGSPFNRHAAPAGAPPGAVALPIDMATNNNPPAQGPPYSLALMNSFRGWDDYRHIYSVSDHLALVIDL